MYSPDALYRRMSVRRKLDFIPVLAYLIAGVFPFTPTPMIYSCFLHGCRALYILTTWNAMRRISPAANKPTTSKRRSPSAKQRRTIVEFHPDGHTSQYSLCALYRYIWKRSHEHATNACAPTTIPLAMYKGKPARVSGACERWCSSIRM